MNIRVIIADESELVRKGFKSILSDHKGIAAVEDASTSADLSALSKGFSADVVFIDYTSADFSLNDIVHLKNSKKPPFIIGIVYHNNPESISNALKAGLDGHILKCCDKDEIVEAIFTIVKGERFFCGKIVKAMSGDEQSSMGCAPLSLSQREIEIISFIGEGFTNKEIADKLFLSTHTVMTHRKNILSKIGVNNTAGVVIFAIKNNLIAPNKYLFSPTN